MIWKVAFPATVCGCEAAQPQWNITGQLFRKLKLELPYDQEIPLLGLYPKKDKIWIKKGISTLMFIATLPITTKTWKHPKCPWTDKLTTLYHQHTMENSSVLIKSLPCRPAWMNLEDIELRGYSQSLKDTYYPRSLKWSNSWKQRVGWLL